MQDTFSWGLLVGIAVSWSYEAINTLAYYTFPKYSHTIQEMKWMNEEMTVLREENMRLKKQKKWFLKE